MKTRRKMAASVGVSVMLLLCIAVSAFASPSISNLHDGKEAAISPESTDGTNTASILSQVEIYTNEAEYSCAMKSHFRKSGNQMSGKWKSSYASLLA